MHPAHPYIRFERASIVLMHASIYLMKVDLAVSNGPQSFSEEHDVLTETLPMPYDDPHHYFMSQLFVGHVASFEVFLQELLTVVISKNPSRVGKTEFKLSEVLEAESTEVLVARAINDFINKLMYKKPLEYRDAIADVLSIDVTAIEDAWKVLLEAKARRDLGVHADWKCNETYLRKLRECGLSTELAVGQCAVPQSGEYLQQVIYGLSSLARKLTAHVLRKIFNLPMSTLESELI